MTTPCAISTLTIPAWSPYADIASAYVQAVADQFGFTADQSRGLGHSLAIILKDIISRTFMPGENQEIQISCERLPIGLKVIIREKGLPLSPEELVSLTADRQTCPPLQFGKNFSCARDSWDEASFYNLGRAGAELDLIKYFTGPENAANNQVCPAGLLTEPPGSPVGPPETFILRPFTPADAQAVIRLLYRTYGYSYPFEHLYYPERLVALNTDGSLQSLVAVSSQGNVVGHLAMFFSKENPALAEMGTGVVDPDFRGHGCLRQLTEYALAEARRRNLSALYGRPVTNHTYSQKVAGDLGFVPCGLQLGLGPAFMSFKQIHEHLPQRESMVLIYRSLIQTSPGTIFPPSRHRDFILKLYAELGLTPVTAQPNGEFYFPGPKLGQMNLTTHQAGSIAIIKIQTIGSATLDELERNLKHLCQSRFDIIHLHLDLSQPEAGHLVPYGESLGFFFAGIIPGLNGTQTLILQYLNNVPLDYDKIQLHSPLAQEILAYVKQADPNRL